MEYLIGIAIGIIIGYIAALMGQYTLRMYQYRHGMNRDYTQGRLDTEQKFLKYIRDKDGTNEKK
jgi:uncharacterized membrane-anchored protein YhcB (DUF1043 family)